MGMWSIRRLMLAIAVVAVFLAGWLGLSSTLPDGRIGRPHCESNLRIVVLALLAYPNREGHFPTGTWPNASLPPEKRLSWYAEILPDLDGQELRHQLHLDQPWDDKSNERVANTIIGVLRCPDRSSPPRVVPMPAAYIGIAGVGTDAPYLPKGHPRAGVFGYDRQTRLADIKDGMSFTMVVVESGRVRGSWLAGGPATVRGLDTADLPYLGPGRQFGSHSNSGAYVAFADGSVRYVKATINPRVFEALSTIAGREHVPKDIYDR